MFSTLSTRFENSQNFLVLGAPNSPNNHNKECKHFFSLRVVEKFDCFNRPVLKIMKFPVLGALKSPKSRKKVNASFEVSENVSNLFRL